MPQGTTHGKTYKVTTLVDENDGGNGGTGLSLREAIAQANDNPGTDKIRFKASLKNGTIVLDGTLDITDGLKIDGLGADMLTVSGNNQSSIFAVTADTTIEGLKLANGTSSINNSANLTLQDSIVTGNAQNSSSTSGSNGIAIYNQGDIAVLRSTVSGNGVGLENRDGTVSIQQSTIADNAATGIYTYGGEVTLSETTISGSSKGIESVYTTAVIDSSTITNNGVGIEGSAKVTNTQVVGNGTGIFGGFVEVDNSTIAENTGIGLYGQAISVFNSLVANNGGDGIEGGYYNAVNVVNSTISGNGGNGIVLNQGSGYEAPVSIFNSTITGNATGGNGYGIASRELTPYTDPLVIGNSIIAGNNGGADIFALVSSQGNNLIGNGDDATGFTNGINGDQVGTAIAPIDPSLGPLQNNGGPTQTYALLPGSTAIDAGNNAIFPTELVLFPRLGADGTVPVDLSFDQRGAGFNRIINGTVDIGAFEVQSGGGVPPEPPEPPATGETIVGTDRKDKLQGSNGGDRIEGLAGKDQINGKDGDDIIVGGSGKDNVTGGTGSDVFKFDSLQDKGDIIRDFEVGADTIDLSSIFSESQYDGFSDDVGRFENYVRVQSRSNGVSVEVDQLGDNGTKFVRMAFVKNIRVADLSIGEFQLTS